MSASIVKYRLPTVVAEKLCGVCEFMGLAMGDSGEIFYSRNRYIELKNIDMLNISAINIDFSCINHCNKIS